MPGIERERVRTGKICALKLREPPVDGRGVVGRFEQVDALGGEQRGGRDQQAVCSSIWASALADDRQFLLGAEPVERRLLDAGAELLEDRRHPDHEELVEVGGGDGQELDPLEQRVGVVLGLGEHPAVELEPAQLAVDVQGGRRQVGGIQP